jgi:hypothetical protein
MISARGDDRIRSYGWFDRHSELPSLVEQKLLGRVDR